MNFTRFPASSTNIFPIANSKTGGQLLTEFNLRSRESVATSTEIKYSVGPSYTHSLDDFSVSVQSGSSTSLEISSGRAVVNGHYLESLVNITVDLAEANAELKAEGLSPLTGKLAIGLRAMYSTEQTLSASMKTENNQNLMEGVQVVILPVGQIAEGYFVLPIDSPDSDEIVSAHLKLAEFNYINGSISNIVQNSSKIQMIPASRVGEFESLLSGNFVSRAGLNPKKLYTFAGKSVDPETGKDTWCDSTDSLFIWQRAADLTTTTDGQLPQAEFGIDDSDQSVTLTLPHKHVDGGMYNTAGEEVYYSPRIMKLPVADFSKNTPGTVTSDYTYTVKAIKESINTIYSLPGGKQRGYVDQITSLDRSELPPINQNNWKIGDYVLVRMDDSVISSSSEILQSPSTFYVILPPVVKSVQYYDYTTDNSIPVGLNGVEVYRMVQSYPGNSEDTPEQVELALSNLISDPDNYNEMLGIATSNYRGTSQVYASDAVLANGVTDSNTEVHIVLEGEEYRYQDYFCIEVLDVPQNGVLGPRYYFYKVVETTGKKEYSDPILITGTIPFATENTIGGFLNVPDTQLDAGYVYRDENGYLRLLDYGLLRTGVLAYQLGQDYDFGSGLSAAEIQDELIEYVNNRVAFPTVAQESSAKYPDMIEITLNLSAEESYNTIEIENIDSRFNTGIYLHITGNANEYTTINIRNCEKIRLDPIQGSPIVNVYNSNLYYDSDVFNYIRNCGRTYYSYSSDSPSNVTIYPDEFTGFENLSIWYQKFSEDDPNLIVDGMTVQAVNTPIIPNELSFWSESVVNDHHYYFGLESITFSSAGNIIGAGIYMRNDLTANIELGKSIEAAQFTLPQGSEFMYPESCMLDQIKITGNFITAYPVTAPDGFETMETTFTALSQKYDKYTGLSNTGTISFLSNVELIDHVIGIASGSPIDGWESNSYHVFRGWII